MLNGRSKTPGDLGKATKLDEKAAAGRDRHSLVKDKVACVFSLIRACLCQFNDYRLEYELMCMCVLLRVHVRVTCCACLCVMLWLVCV